MLSTRPSRRSSARAIRSPTLGLGLPIIGKLLGHTNAATTQKYAHLDTDPLRRASDHIGERVAAAMGLKTTQGAQVIPLKDLS
jgi:hypothetical protein